MQFVSFKYWIENVSTNTRNAQNRLDQASALDKESCKSYRYKDPDSIYGYGSDRIPFIYSKNHILHVGKQNDKHFNIYDREQDLQQKNAKDWEEPRGMMQLNSLAGRIGNMYDPGNGIDRHIVSFWNSPQEIMNLLYPCLQELLKRKMIEPNTEVHHPKLHDTTVSAYLTGNTQTRNDPELEKRVELQRQLHIMPAVQKKNAMKELGLSPRGKPNKWVQAIKATGIPVGSSHFFPTSENFISKNQ